MLAEFQSWWLQRLLELVPSWLSLGDDSEASAHILAFAEAVPGAARDRDAEPGLMLLQRRPDRVTEIGAFDQGAHGIAALRQTLRSCSIATGRLRAPAGALLEKTLSLPLAAETAIAEILENEIDRETPFSPDEVYWSYRILGRNRATGRLQVLLSIVPTASLGPLPDLAAAAGFPAAAIEAPSRAGTLRLLPLDRALIRHDLRYWELRGAAAACLILSIAVVALPFVRQSHILAATEARIDEIRVQAETAQAIRRRLSAEAPGTDAIVAERHAAGDILHAVAEATRILPDGTYLTDLAFSRRRLTLTGRSTDTATLVPALSKSPDFHDPALTAPVTHLEGSSYDLFSLAADAGP